MAGEGLETPDIVEREGKKSRWTEFLTPISIGIAAIGLIVNFVMQFQEQIKKDVKDTVDHLQRLTEENATNIRALRTQLDGEAAILSRVSRYVPQTGVTYASIPISASDDNCEATKIRKPPDGFYPPSAFTSICTISKDALTAIPPGSKIIASVLANSHYNLRLVGNDQVGSLSITSIARKQPPNDRGSEGHAETIITLNDVTLDGGTFFVSRPYTTWSPHSDTGWLWIGSMIVFYTPP